MSTSASEINNVLAASTRSNIRCVDATASLGWLRQGLRDFRNAPGLSLLYGFLFAGLCAGVYLLASNVPWYSVGYLTGLVVVGPFLAAGLYVASRDMQRGVAPSIDNSLRLLIQRRTYLALFSLLLALVMAAWVRFSALLLAVKFNTLSPSVETYTAMMSSSEGWITLGFFIAIGFVLAVAVFAISAVAIPLILDRDVDFMSAMSTSFRAVTGNLGTMALWAGIFILLTAVGIATAFVGLAIITPILGYATWHSYRALEK